MKAYIFTFNFLMIFVTISAIEFGKNGMTCSSQSECGPTLNHCCGGLPNGKYCAQCCTDANCPAGKLCIPGYNYPIINIPGYSPSGPMHSRFCVRPVSGGEKCFRNDMCISGRCIGALGWSGDSINLPLGRCAF
jgi:hypothetical protein